MVGSWVIDSISLYRTGTQYIYIYIYIGNWASRCTCTQQTLNTIHKAPSWPSMDSSAQRSEGSDEWLIRS